jgi:hypothetical protein
MNLAGRPPSQHCPPIRTGPWWVKRLGTRRESLHLLLFMYPLGSQASGSIGRTVRAIPIKRLLSVPKEFHCHGTRGGKTCSSWLAGSVPSGERDAPN